MRGILLCFPCAGNVQELLHMFVPEYTITSKTLKNIALIEYSKAIIETTVILPSWEKQLQRQTLIDTICANLSLENINIHIDDVKKALDNVDTNADASLVVSIRDAFETNPISGHELNESDLKLINQRITTQQTYRNRPITNKATPEEILAEVVELFDWINSIDARDTHPIIVAGITMGQLNAISPFERLNTTTTNLFITKVLNAFNYSLKNIVSVDAFFNREQRVFHTLLNTIKPTSSDFTTWIEYFSEAFSIQTSTAQEKVKLLAKDTKIAKVTGRIKLTQRQEKIVEYLQDYGILQNKDFPRLFPEKSEDSILRDLKVLVDKGIIKKQGSTKSSRYELS